MKIKIIKNCGLFPHPSGNISCVIFDYNEIKPKHIGKKFTVILIEEKEKA